MGGSSQHPISTNLDFLSGGREMAKAIREKDWSRTPLGPVETWPQSLRTTVSLCVASVFPISIAWGPHRVQIYNDGYWPICAAKHPHSMGQDFKECWFSAWPAIGEAFERAQNGETSFLENQRMFLDRNGYLEETFFTFSFSPIRDESGGVGGLFHPVTETTARMLAERRTQCLRDLVARSAKARTVEEVCAVVAEVLTEHSLDLPFGLLYLFEHRDSSRIAATFGIAPEATGCFKDWPLAAAGDTGRPILVDDIWRRAWDFPCGPYPEPPEQAYVLPISAPGLERMAGALVVGVSSRLPLDDAYRTYLDLLATHVATAVSSARAYEEERRKAEALAEIDRAKTAFFSNVSHEFRTPLTLMLGPLEGILAREDAPREEVKDAVERVHRNGLRLLKLVNTLLDFSRIEAGRVQAVYQPTDLSQLTAYLASAFRSAMDSAGLTLKVDCPPLGEPVYVDREMWEKIVLNLISNAFKFTFQGKITVRLRLKNAEAVLTVRDTGTGIAKNELPRVFERFHRIEGAPGRSHEGTGIGLALVQELARLHGGSIAVESELGVGSVFTLRIPRGWSHLATDRIRDERPGKPAREAARSYVDEALRWLPDAPAAELPEGCDDAPPPAAGDSRASILLADDNADMRDYLHRILVDRYEVHAVADGVEALEFARLSPVDLVLTDVMMPRMDGFELLRQLRADPRTKATPIIMLSARAGEEARVEGLDAGADDYLIKPFTVRELLARVDSQLRMSKVRLETAALRQSERHFRTIADCAPVMMWTCSPDRRCDYFNRGWLAYTGRTAEDEIDAGWTANIHPEDAPRCVAMFETSAGAGYSFDIEFRLRRHDVAYRWVYGSGAPRYLHGGEFLGYVFSCVDIDDRNRAQIALQASQHRLQMALDAGNEGLWEWDVESGKCYFSPRYYGILGFAPDEFPAHYDSWIGRLHPEDRRAAIEKRDEHLVRRPGSFNTEYRLKSKSGAYVWVQSRGKVTEWAPDGRPIRLVGTITDIGERRNLEEQFHQAQRLESIGRLAGGVAHDFNNLLTVINGYADIADEELAPDDPVRTRIEQIRAAGERAAGLTRQLLAFSRKQILQTSVINLNSVVKEVTAMLRRLIGEDIKLVTRAAASLGNITADAGQLQQIVMNLTVNSRDAMPRGGTLIIETANIALDDSYVSGHPEVPAGEYVMLAVTDDGMGMSPEVQARIFEPFFTTKGKSQGTGLGLATVYGIVKQMGGWIWVYSEVGRGTTFKVYFPRTDEAADPVQAAPKTDLRGDETILVVEDQAEVRALAVTALKRYGYTVHSAADALEAIAFCKTHEGPLELVLTDVVMPGLSGRELANELAKIRPGLLILFTSGYTDNAIGHQGVLDEGVEYIQKPFTPEGLAAKIREVLGRRSG